MTTATITAEQLEARGGREYQVDLFRKHFPNGLTYGEADIPDLAGKYGSKFDVDGVAESLLSAPHLKAYQGAEAQLWKAYEDAEAPFWKAYMDADATLLKAYMDADATLLKAYRGAEAQLWKAYEDAKAAEFLKLYLKEAS